MNHFRDRYDVIEWLIATCKRQTVVRALETGKIEFLGAFYFLPPTGSLGWCLNVKSEYGKEWSIAVVPDLTTIWAIRLKQIPWKDYVGGTSELYQGDHPEKYVLLRDKENEKRENTREGYTKE